MVKKTKNKIHSRKLQDKFIPKKSEQRITASIISPWVDFLCVGGLSIALMLGLLIYIWIRQIPEHQEIYFGSFLILQALINWPHFMASYRLLYTPKGNIKKYPFATIYVPAILILLAGVSVALSKAPSEETKGLYLHQDTIYLIWLVAAFYLAWHYTGQAWGMIASFSHLANIKMNNQERWLIRSGLRVLLVWHVIWGAQDLPEDWLGPFFQFIPSLLSLISALAIFAFLIGAATFICLWRRTKRKPTPQMLAPWCAIYLWYLVLNFEPNTYLFVQLSHALQYLIFPLRVELNRQNFLQFKDQTLQQMTWGCRYYLLLFTGGTLAFYAPETVILSANQPYTLAILISSIIAIHHYFVDGCIWKISNRQVRNELFAHIQADVKKT